MPGTSQNKIMLGSEHLNCKDLNGYLKTLPGQTLLKLYTHPATCLAVFRFALYSFSLMQSVFEERITHYRSMLQSVLLPHLS